MSTFSHSGYGDLPCLPRASISQSRSGPSSSANGGEDLSGEERAAASRAKVERKRRGGDSRPHVQELWLRNVPEPRHEPVRPGSYAGSGLSSWIAQVLPSGSSKNAKREPREPGGPSCCTSLTGTPRAARASRTASRSSTTSWTPLTEPGFAERQPLADHDVRPNDHMRVRRTRTRLRKRAVVKPNDDDLGAVLVVGRS